MLRWQIIVRGKIPERKAPEREQIARAARELVQKLVRQGHSVRSAALTLHKRRELFSEE